MSNAYNPQYFHLDEIYISEIIFDESENISLFCYLFDEGQNKLVRWDLFSDFTFLTDILLFAGNEGEVIIKILSEKLSVHFDIPTVINIEELFDKPLYVDSFIFKVYRPHEKDENGIWHPANDNYLYMDSMEVKEEFLTRQPETYIAKIKDGKIIYDLLEEALSNIPIDPYQKQLTEYLNVLENAFKYYLILLNKEFTEKEARRRAGLSDELLYRIAFYNNKINNNKK
jgi:hypothetical protein